MVPALAALLTAVSAGAQNAQLDGLLVTASQFTPVDMMKYSQNNYSFTTGRVAAMGGAFTALGGDMASMGINPAGLGMYRNSVWGLSPAMTFTGNRNAYATAHDNNASRFSFNNIGTVLQLSQRSNGLVSFNLGLSYNKMEDFNYRGSVRLPAAAGGSLLNIFQLQLNGLYDFFNTGTWNGLSEKDLNSDPFNNGNIYIDEWGAVLGYQSGLFPGLGGDNMYGLNGLPENSNITPSLRYDSRGSVGEYNIAGGFNINNILYLGFDFGFRDIYQRLSLYYSEDYEGNYSGTAQQYLRQMNYNQYLLAQGSAFNFKIGAIVRPIPQLHRLPQSLLLLGTQRVLREHGNFALRRPQQQTLYVVHRRLRLRIQYPLAASHGYRFHARRLLRPVVRLRTGMVQQDALHERDLRRPGEFPHCHRQRLPGRRQFPCGC